ncbi:putative HTH-type transcriptional regulator YfiR [Peptococcaceae bacterium CEB3]|nr:putative HTH-type transcriptional regulator YfiR [Peptococcaceae bacterium CEB3]
MGVREEQKEKRREEILTAGLNLFIRKGYAATKISDIAERVGMSVGLLFHYFESKEKLYEALIALGISGPMSVIAPTDMEPLEFFERTAEQIFHYIQTDPFVAQMFVLMSQAFYNEAVPPSIKELLMGFDIYTPTTLLIQKGQADGTIREGDPYALAIAYWCAIQGIAEQLALNPDVPCPESDWIVDMIRRKA